MSERAAVSWEILHQEGFYPEESSGLFVGISSFEDDRFAPVRFAVDDAIDLAWVFVLELGLLDARRCVLALTGAPQKRVSAERLSELLAAGARTERPRLREVYRLATELSQSGGERGLFLLSVATHGLSDQGGDYLVAADSLRDRLLKTGVEVKDLFDLAAKSQARRRLVLLDACRERLNEGTSSLAGAAMSKSFAGAISRATGLTVLSAATVGGYAYDDRSQQNGVFSGALVAGLRGAAPADGRGFITVATLAQYAQERVQAWVRMHRQEHLAQNQGIEKRTDGWAEQLPLAIDPQRSRTMAEYQRRRALALVRLKENIGEILDGRSFDELKAFLPDIGLPSTEVSRLLHEIEALNGSEISQRSLLHLFGELRTGRNESEPGGPLPLVNQPAPQPPAPLRAPSVARPEIQRTPMIQKLPSVSRSLVTEIFRKWLAGVVLAVPVSLLVGWLVLGFGGTKKAELIEQPVADPPVVAPKQPEPEPGAVVTDTFGQRYRWVPGGTYTVGSPQWDMERTKVEEQREVSVKGFWLAETEMTQEQWKRHGLRNRSAFDTCTTCPVEQVSWWEVAALANQLSSKVKLEACYDLEGCESTNGFKCLAGKLKSVDCTGYRLPTEEEWEVAARAQLPGTEYRVHYGELDAIAWHQGNSVGQPHPVGKKLANVWGLHDMLGNVSEWTSSTSSTSSTGSSFFAVIRGGSWRYDARLVRAAHRSWYEPRMYYDHLGFRFSLGRPRSGQEKEGRGVP